MAAIEVEHVDCVVSFLGDSDEPAANAYRVLNQGSEALILAIARKIDFPKLFPEALATTDNIDKASTLLKIGYRISEVSNLTVKRNRQPYQACRAGQIDMLSFFHSHGFDFNSKDPYGWTPLMAAADGGNLAVVKMLLGFGVRIGDDDGTGATALMYAAWSGRKDCIRELVKYGADINAVDEDGWTAMVGALWFNDDESAARVLFALGTQLDIQPNGRSSVTPARSIAQIAIASQDTADARSKVGPLGDWFVFVVSGEVMLV